jgi:glycosyltransferase involved in cell wall biosynthesis
VATILVLSNMYPPHHHGGYELSCRDVVDRWRDRGHEVTVLTSTMRIDGVADPPDERANGVWRDLEISYRNGDLYDPPYYRRIGIERRNHAVLRKTLDAVRPDVVSIWHMGAMSTSLLTDLVATEIPLVYVICDDWLTYADKIDPWMRMFRTRRWLGRPAQSLLRLPTTMPDVGASGAFCFISELNQHRSTEHSPWEFAMATVSYNGIDHRDFPVLDTPPDRPWHWRLVSAGRLDPRKGFETPVRALARLPGATLELLPSVDDPYREHLEKVAADLGVEDRLRFTIVDRAGLRERYSDADVFVFPTEWAEPFGLVPLEAMACGTPVVATGTGGSGEFLIDGVNCLRFDVGDDAGLAAAVRRLAADPTLRQRLVAAGLRTARELSVDHLADNLEAWHLAAAERFAHGRPADRALEIA